MTVHEKKINIIYNTTQVLTFYFLHIFRMLNLMPLFEWLKRKLKSKMLNFVFFQFLQTVKNRKINTLKKIRLNSRLINVDIYASDRICFQHHVGSQWVSVAYGNFSAISRRDQVTFQWDEDEVPTRLVGFNCFLFFCFVVFIS